MPQRLNRLFSVVDLLMKTPSTLNDIQKYLLNIGDTLEESELCKILDNLNLFLDNDQRFVINDYKNGHPVYEILKLEYDVQHLPSKYMEELLISNSHMGFANYNKGYIGNINIKKDPLKISYYPKTCRPEVFALRTIGAIPIKLVQSRGYHYLQVYNLEAETFCAIEWQSIIDCKPIIHPYKEDIIAIEERCTLDFKKRFGMSKNIDATVYNIKLSFNATSGNYIKQYDWHHSQRFEQKRDKVIMHLNCGINNDLVRFIWRWLDEVDVQEPKVLKELVNVL